MFEVTIYFFGICTHIKEVTGVPHRVVLIHEDHTVRINGFDIRSHRPSIQLVTGTLLSGELPSLGRQILSVANAGEGAPSYDDLYQCAIPSLQKLSGEVDLLQLNTEVAIDRQLPAIAYFDVHQGCFSAVRASHGATAAMLTVETTGNPTLTVTSMDGNGDPVQFELSSGAVLAIRNEADGPENHIDADFLLHYKVTTSIPPGSPFPTMPIECDGLPPLPIADASFGFDLGPGCSNSHYP